MQPVERPSLTADVSFDGGDLDCGNGLLLLIRQHMDPMARGQLLEFRSTEISVDEDFPAWCRMTGNEGPSCCCMAKRAAKAKLAKQAKRPPTIRGNGCCDLKVTAGAERPASTIAPDLQIPPAAVVGRLPVELSVAIAPHESLVIAERARGPPPLGAPLYLENCAFLS